MNKSVPTLLGIVIILLVVVLVVLLYHYQLTKRLAAGESVVGTVGGTTLTGVQPPTEEIGVGEVLAGREPESQAVPAPTLRPEARRGQRAGERRGPAQEGQGPGAGQQPVEGAPAPD